MQADRAKQLYGVGPYFLSKVRARVGARVRLRVRALALALTLTLTLTLTLALLPARGRGGGAALRTPLCDGRRPALPTRRPAVERRGSNCTPHTHRTHARSAARRCGAPHGAAGPWLVAGRSWLPCMAALRGRPLRRPHVGPALTSTLPWWPA